MSRNLPESLYSIKGSNFDAFELPQIKEIRGKEYMYYGKKNLFPNKLIELCEIYDIEYSECNTGEDKVNFDFEFYVPSEDLYFTVYDWKENEPLHLDTTYEFHIGTRDLLTSMVNVCNLRIIFFKSASSFAIISNRLLYSSISSGLMEDSAGICTTVFADSSKFFIEIPIIVIATIS